jgi:hypothetical protein
LIYLHEFHHTEQRMDRVHISDARNGVGDGRVLRLGP